MLSTLRNAWRVPELRRRILFTLMIVAIFRMGIFIPVPGVDASKVATLVGDSGSLLSFYDMIAGGAFSKFSIFALGVTPYINASIIIQLLTVAIPYLEELSKEGQDGRKKIQNYTKYAAMVFALIQGYASYVLIKNSGAILIDGTFGLLLILLTMITGTMLLVWIGEQISTRGIGSGVSVIIFVNIISSLPTTGYQIAGLLQSNRVSLVEVVIFVAVALALLVTVVVINLAERRIPVQYAGKAVGRKVVKSQSSHIPISLNSSGVMAIIFGMSVMQFPTVIAQIWPNSSFAKFVTSSPWSIFQQNTLKYVVAYFLLILFFAWFYTIITFKPDEMAENMNKSSGFIPGIRPGEKTAAYLEKILTRISLLGGTFAAIIAVVPILAAIFTNFQGISFGGTSLLILVGVSLDTMKQLESQLVMRHYEGFLK
ncbi:MAG: preprotein translocase subunit SecY [Clostridium sp.]|uniref:preprotein translocase subunit SecY n=1 Tax=Clostridium culturomicium TaxID=1499683 RepID=UPI0005901029|nr:preprotein translocase subunit SecY [Clostridium culturomicium]MDU4891209.1 preprotein translocase subunit SecY [Clostridium sp.]MDU7085408.1 preprotein translocase subunit SecY [Clostridium sp.]